MGDGIDHIDRSLRVDVDNLNVRNLKTLILRLIDQKAEAEALLKETRALDPLYIAEISPADIRGRLGSLNQFVIVIGILLAQIVNRLIARPVPAGIPSNILMHSWNVQYGWRWVFSYEAQRTNYMIKLEASKTRPDTTYVRASVQSPPPATDRLPSYVSNCPLQQ